MYSGRYRKLTLAIVGLVAVALAACGGSSSKSTADPPGSTPAATGVAALPDNPATGEPIKIGFINNEGGAAFSAPEVTTGSKDAVDYLNDRLG